MHEVKSVKVDNWGVFFLQKLQNFFNKTDYCDLTLQFKDNSQLKVHRLVLSACTDFFNVLESRYEVVDDILIMPKDLQADVVVPIVNFMYTGTLEFEVNMYARLLKTAKDMNMTVLLKLLEAHKRTVGDSIRSQNTSGPVVLNKAAGQQRVNTYSRPGTSTAGRTYTQRQVPTTIGSTKISPARSNYPVSITKIKTEKIGSTIVRSIPSSNVLRKNLPEPVQLVAKYANSPGSAVKGPSRFECTDDSASDAFESSFDNISYESKPLITASQLKEEKSDHEGSFEKLKRGAAGGVKRHYSGGSVTSPPEKKPNIQEVKEFTEAHRQREKLVAEEFEDDPDCFGDDFQNNDDDDDDYEPPASVAASTRQSKETSQPTEHPSVIIKSENNQPMTHAKIIQEVLKKYPHLVKNNKNIKLKIMQKGNNSVHVSAVPKEPEKTEKLQKVERPQRTSPATRSQTQTRSQVSTPVQKVLKKVVPASKESTPAQTPPATNQPKKIDSRTMHALIAMGAENMSGPWLCLECGVNGRPISIPSYRGFRRHLINVHKKKIDSRLCEHCGWRSRDRPDMHYHLLMKHNIKPPNDLHFPKCGLCSHIAIDAAAMRAHRQDDHQTESSKQVCIYCNKQFLKEIHLYSHMRQAHKDRAREDGVMDFSEDEGLEDDNDKYVPNNPEPQTTSSSDNKIKVLSNIALPSKSPFVVDGVANTSNIIASAENISLEPSSEAEGLSNVASGIATSLAVLDTDSHLDNDSTTYGEDLQSSQYIEAAMANVHGEILSESDKKQDQSGEVETKFITEEGSELELTAAQKAELLEQLQGQSENLNENVVMVLNDSYENQSTDSQDNSGVVLVQTGGKDEEAGDESDANISADNVSADDSIESKDADKEEKGKGETTNLISALEGDWTEDEEDEKKEKKSVGSAAKKQEDKEPEKKQQRKIVDDSYDSTSLSSNSSKPDETKEKIKEEEKNVPNLILDDWDSQQSEKNEEDEDEDDKVEENKLEKKNGDDKDATKDDVKEIKEKKDTNEKKPSQSKTDLKTLINDWGDEDEEGF